MALRQRLSTVQVLMPGSAVHLREADPRVPGDLASLGLAAQLDDDS